MIDSDTLRQALKEIYGVEDKYLVPLDTSWYVPTYDKNDKVGTWIGYRILSVKPNVRAGNTGNGYEKSVKCRFRVTFMGPQAEELALQTLLFDERSDVIKAFEKSYTQLNYIAREILTYPIKESGLNNSLCWFVDFDCQSFYKADAHYGRWSDSPPPQPEYWTGKLPPASEDERLHSGDIIIHR